MTPWLAAGAGIVVAAVLALNVPRAELTYSATPAAKDPGTTARADHPKPPYPAARAEVQYQTIQRWPAGFTGLITIRSQSALRHWRLAFRYPGADIDSVAGAKWVVRGDGGIATAVPWPWGRPSGNIVRIMIVANGTPGHPTNCRFDGTRCSFG